MLIKCVKKKIWELKEASVGENLRELFYTVSHYAEFVLAQISIDNRIAKEHQNN